MASCELHLPGDALDYVYPGREPEEDALDPFLLSLLCLFYIRLGIFQQNPIRCAQL